MSANVFANGREVSAEKDTTHISGAMPDVCLSPPGPPAGPIPIPYPNFAQASDTAKGARSVKIKGGQVGIKSESHYATCKGDEAATRSFGMNVIEHCIQGKTVSQAWSFNVKFEGKNAKRLLDLSTNNNR
ncbi:DUF4150 domain-containing protein [Roseateles amylovorans]|uniref:DUF4150 domain-containing protein n=1 Tax=Roseateles amylovorans TaxID=2978473 RepID=A0ABY6B5I7_9BURK|nr:DUF4150 domain-containing protein [Roseateles amylovorans]UXH80656.1 DUF4150 domain-containing protein [Roseateles amylovorans]